ncbi:hypothetical protein KI387_010209, partial [Taxus chinensis]
DEGSELGDDDGQDPDLEIPSLDEKDEKDYLEVAAFIEGGKLDKLKVEQCKLYLRKHGLRLSGKKAVLIERIQEHLEIKDGSGEKKYPKSSFVLNCKGDACTGDIVMFEQKVYEMFSIASRSAVGPTIGTRLVVGRIVKESYGAAKQQHTFTIEVLWSKGEKPLHPLHPLLIKGRNLYKLQTVRQPWPNEEDRKKVLHEKHSRGSLARNARDVRVQHKENNRSHQVRNTQKQTVSASNGNVVKNRDKINLERKPLAEANGISLPVPEICQNIGYPNIVHSAAGSLSSNACTYITPSNGSAGNTRPMQGLTHMARSDSRPAPGFHNGQRETMPGLGSRPAHGIHNGQREPTQGLSGAQRLGSRSAPGIHYGQRELCWHFLRGRCHYGDRCKFFHDNSMLRFSPNCYQMGVQNNENKAQINYRYS